MRNIRVIGIRIVIVLSISTAMIIWLSHDRIEATTDDQILKVADAASVKHAALVLGCSQFLADGRENLFFRHRMDRAAELFETGLVRTIIVSGDNSRQDYDEPTDMRNALIERGVPGERIYSDYAGFRTLDSIVRAREIFQQESFYVVTQEFHARRAVYIANNLGMTVTGIPARDVTGRHGVKTHLREYLARVKTMIDVHLTRSGPKFLGDRIEIGQI